MRRFRSTPRIVPIHTDVVGSSAFTPTNSMAQAQAPRSPKYALQLGMSNNDGGQSNSIGRGGRFTFMESPAAPVMPALPGLSPIDSEGPAPDLPLNQES